MSESTPDPSAVRTAIVGFIASEVAPHVDAGSLSDEVNLVEDGVIDSLGIFSLVGFIEEEYDIEIDLEDLTPDNFETIPAIMGLVATTVHRSSPS